MTALEAASESPSARSVFSGGRWSEPERALGLFRRALELDPYTPEIAMAVEDLEKGGVSSSR